MIIDCPHMSHYRNMCDIGPYVRLYRKMQPQISSVKLYAMYLDDHNHEEVQKKALSLYCMKHGWSKLMNMPLVI